MKQLFKIFIVTFILGFSLASCDKKNELSIASNGAAPVLSASTPTFAPVAADSLTGKLSFSWTDPKYASDPSTFRYELELDSAGRNFAVPQSRTIIGKLTESVIAKEMNTLLFALGFKINVPGVVQVRLKSSYNNYNERYVSNILNLNVTPYKIPPMVALPTTSHLYIVGDGSDFGWTNPSSMPPVRELTRLDETTWQGIFKMYTTGQYLLLPLAGSWDNKFAVANNSITGLSNGGSFGFNLNDNFPVAGIAGGTGWKKMTYDFQAGKFTAVQESNPLGADLWITGDGTASSWTNAPPASQKFTQKTNGVFEITLPLVPGKYLKFLNTNGQWQPQFGGNNASGGDLGANYGTGGDPDAVPTPATAGTYKITVNFLTKKYTVTP